MSTHDDTWSAARFAARRIHRRPPGTPHRAKARTVATAVGPIGIWYWQRADGSWAASYEGQPVQPSRASKGEPKAFGAIGLAGQAARRQYGAPRRTVTTRTRFLVLDRDGFACAYCGRTPPEVVLEVDHLIPVARGGSSEPDNLITACRQCNAGKATIPFVRTA